MKTGTMLLTMGIALVPFAVKALSLDEARQMAHDNYPAIRQYRIIDQGRDFTIDNVAKGWLPKVSVSAGGYAFTNVLNTNAQATKMGLDLRNWMASGAITVTQSVYDGGQIAAQRQVVSAQSNMQSRQLDVSMYAINERIDQLFFGILLLDEQLRQNNLLLLDLATSEESIRSMMKGGIANQCDLDVILVEKLNASQQGVALKASRKSYLRMLGVFIGKSLTEDEPIDMPCGITSLGKASENHPELTYNTSMNSLLDAQRRLIDTKLRPTVSVFGTGIIHTKVSDLLNSGMLMCGISVSWNIGALYTRKNDIKKLDVQKAMNDSQREIFLFQNRLKNEEANGTIESLRKQIEQDEEIIGLRESIRSKGDKKVKLGTESVNELVRDIHAVSLARAQKAQHEIMLLKEIYNQKNFNNE